MIQKFEYFVRPLGIQYSATEVAGVVGALIQKILRCCVFLLRALLLPLPKRLNEMVAHCTLHSVHHKSVEKWFGFFGRYLYSLWIHSKIIRIEIFAKNKKKWYMNPQHKAHKTLCKLPTKILFEWKQNIEMGNPLNRRWREKFRWKQIILIIINIVWWKQFLGWDSVLDRNFYSLMCRSVFMLERKCFFFVHLFILIIAFVFVVVVAIRFHPIQWLSYSSHCGSWWMNYFS